MKKIMVFVILMFSLAMYFGCKAKEVEVDTQAEPTIEIDGIANMSTSVFVEDKHVRSDDYSRPFDVMFYEDNELSVGFMKDLYTDEILLLKLNDIKWDYKVLESELGAAPKDYTLYVVDETIAGGSYVVGDKIYCSKADFESGD